jgi:subtilisin family serine protease/uncharacterized protein YkwD
MLSFKPTRTKLRGLFVTVVLIANLLPWTGGVRAEPPQPTPVPTQPPFAYGVSFLSPDGQVGTAYRGEPDSGSALVTAEADELVAEALRLLNDARQAAGLPAFLSSEALAQAAADHAQDQLTKGFFGHQSSDGSWPAERAARKGHSSTYLAQNLTVGHATAEAAVDAWLTDDGSRTNLLDARLTHAGLAFAHNGPWHNYWVLMLSEPPAYRPGRVLVRFQPTVATTSVQEALQQLNAAPVGQIGSLDVERLAVPLGQEVAVVVALQQNPAVVFAELDYRVQATLEPNDPYYADRWWWEKIQASAGWDVTIGSEDVIIAVIDTGVDLDHPDLAAKIVAGYDFANDDEDPDDDHGHGTHVAGIAAAATNNGIGVAGFAWGARIMPLKVLDEHGDGWFSDVAAAVTYATDHGAKVVNLSLGGPSPSSPLQDAMDYAHSGGVLIVAAAGNCGDSNYSYNGCNYQHQPLYPAAGDHTLAVASTTSTDGRSSFSTIGSYVDVAAPGSSIYSTYMGGGYGYKSGTSMATPLVSGMAALVFSIDSDLTPYQVQAIIEQSADDLGDLGRDDAFGWGRINAHQALDSFYISGQISTTHGTLVADAAVTISGTGILSTTLTNPEGQYLQTGLITGTYVVAPSQGSASFTPVSRTVSLGPDSAHHVDFVRDDFLVYLPLVAKKYAGPPLLPDDPFFSSQWGLHNIGQTGGTPDADIDAPLAWAYQTGDVSVTIAILDTGVDLDHSEFSGRLTTGWDFANGDSNPDDDHGHGTHVAGIAAAAGNNGAGVAGVAWNVRIMPIKVLDSQGSGDYFWMIQGINHAINNGANVINLSLGGTANSQAMQDAVTNAYNNGVLVVAAAGNCGDENYALNGCSYQDQPLYPAAGDHALAVASTDHNDIQSSFSTQGSYVDIAAPGSAIYSTYMGGGYGYKSGTSMATPFVAGLACLIYSQYPSYTPDEVAQAIVHNADDLGTSGRDDVYGCGRINAYRSLAYGAASSDCSGWTTFSLENAPVQAGASTDAEFRPGVLLVKFQEVTSLAEREDVLATHSLTTLSVIEGLEIHLIAVPEGQELALVETLNAEPSVAYAEPNYKIYAFPPPP